MKDAEKLVKAEEKAVKDAEKLVQAEEKASAKVVVHSEVVSVDSSDEEEAEMAGQELVAEPVFPLDNFEEELSASEDEEELELNDTMKVEISGVSYFKTPAFGLPAVLFSYPTGETVGAYDEATGEIQELSIEEE